MSDISTFIPQPGCSYLPSLSEVQAYLQPGGSKPLFRLIDSNQTVVATEIQDLLTARMTASVSRLAKHVQVLCGDSRQHLLWGLDMSPEHEWYLREIATGEADLPYTFAALRPRADVTPPRCRGFVAYVERRIKQRPIHLNPRIPRWLI